MPVVARILRGHIASRRRLPGRGDQRPLPDEDAGLLRAGHHVGGLAVPADGRQPQGPPEPVMVQHPVEHGGFSRVCGRLPTMDMVFTPFNISSSCEDI